MRAIKGTSGGGGGGAGGAVTTKTTTTAAIQTIDTVPIPTDKVVKISVDVSAKKDDLTEKGGFIKEAIFANNSGTVTKQGATGSLFHEAQAGWDVTFVISGTDVLIRVTGAAATNIDWKSSRVTLEV
ncbi:MAG: hypothetical protein GWP19_03795 [Planctomycetia bacterium]|nr:hypothetical protein [Planctomycetia bacterium]